MYAYGEIDWINIYRFISKKNYQELKTFCFVFRYGCLLLVREQLNKKNQVIYIGKFTNEGHLVSSQMRDVSFQMNFKT